MSPLPGLANVIVAMLPEVFAYIRARQEMKGAPVPTEDEIKAALATAVQSSIARDEEWLRLHPDPNG